MAAVLKTARGASSSWVRIPRPPPLTCACVLPRRPCRRSKYPSEAVRGDLVERPSLSVGRIHASRRCQEVSTVPGAGGRPCTVRSCSHAVASSRSSTELPRGSTNCPCSTSVSMRARCRDASTSVANVRGRAAASLRPRRACLPGAARQPPHGTGRASPRPAPPRAMPSDAAARGAEKRTSLEHVPRHDQGEAPCLLHAAGGMRVDGELGRRSPSGGGKQLSAWRTPPSPRPRRPGGPPV